MLFDESEKFVKVFGSSENSDKLVGKANIILTSKDQVILESVITELNKLRDHFRKISLLAQLTPINDFSFIDSPLIIYIDESCELPREGNNIDINCSIHNRLVVENTNNLVHLGYQRHFHTLDEIAKLDIADITHLSLGKLRTEKESLEPVIRDVNQCNINLAVLKSCEIPSNKNSYPTGLTTEELCQMCKYLGGATSLRNVKIELGSQDGQAFKIASLLVWYLLEGINQFIQDHPSKSTDFNSFMVEVDEHDIEFIRHSQTHRYWAKLDDRYIATTHEEYLNAINGLLPKRMSKHLV